MSAMLSVGRSEGRLGMGEEDWEELLLDIGTNCIGWKLAHVPSQKKTFPKICRDDYAKVYIAMAVCKGRGDGIKHKVKHT